MIVVDYIRVTMLLYMKARYVLKRIPFMNSFLLVNLNIRTFEHFLKALKQEEYESVYFVCAMYT